MSDIRVFVNVPFIEKVYQLITKNYKKNKIQLFLSGANDIMVLLFYNTVSFLSTDHNQIGLVSIHCPIERHILVIHPQATLIFYKLNMNIQDF
jgi:hypothetical protein